MRKLSLVVLGAAQIPRGWKGLSSAARANGGGGQIDLGTWRATNKLKGKVLDTHTRKLSPVGKTLTEKIQGTKPNGATIDETIVFDRVSGGSGLAGKWKTKNVQNNSTDVMDSPAWVKTACSSRFQR